LLSWRGGIKLACDWQRLLAMRWLFLITLRNMATSETRKFKGHDMTINERNNNLGKQDISHDHSLQDIAGQSQSVDESRRRFTKSGLLASGVLLTLASRPSLGGGTVYGAGQVCKSPSGFLSGNLSHHGKPHGGGGHSCDYWKSHCSSSDWGKCDRSKNFCDEFGFSHNNNSHYGCKVTYYNKNTYGSYSKSTSGSAKTYDVDGSSSLYVPYTCLDILSLCHAGHTASGYKSSCDVTLTSDRYGRVTGVKNNCYSSTSCPDLTTCRSIGTGADMDHLAQHCMKSLLNCRAGLTPFLAESTVKSIYNECRTKGYFQPTAGVQWTPSQCVSYLKSTEDCTYYS